MHNFEPSPSLLLIIIEQIKKHIEATFGSMYSRRDQVKFKRTEVI